MANWKYKVDIHDVWINDDMPIQEKGKAIGAALKSTFPESWFDEDSDDYDDVLDALYHDFQEIDGDDVERFDSLMDELYDYGDCEVHPFNAWPPNKMAWIRTR